MGTEEEIMDRDRLLQALAAADAAGNADDARFLAEQLRALETPTRDPKAEYDAMSTPQQIGTATADMLRLASNGLTLGFRDKMAAGLKSLFDDEGGTYAEQLANERLGTEDAKARAGTAGTAAEIGGGLVLGGTAAKGGLSLMDRVPQATGFLKRLAAMSAAGGAEGAVYGAGQAAGNDTDILEGAQSGMGFGVAGGAAGETIGTMLNKFLGRGLGHAAPAPTIDELDALEQQGRRELSNRNFQLAPDQVAKMNDQLRRNLTDAVDGPRPQRHPAAVTEINKLAEYTPSLQDPKIKATNTVRESQSDAFNTTIRNNNPPVMNSVRKTGLSDATSRTTRRNLDPDRGLSLYDLDLHRQAVQKNVANHADTAESGQGVRIIKELDNFVRGNVPKKEADQLFETREVGHRKRKLEEVGAVARSAERQTARKNDPTGRELQGKIASVLDNARKTKGYKPEEVQMMEEIVKGTKWGNRARSAGELAGSYKGSIVGGALAGIPLGLVTQNPTVAAAGGALGAATIGTGVSKILNNAALRSTEKQADELMDLIARGTKKPARKPVYVVAPEGKTTLARALALLGIEDDGGN
jgi:hypothetical protein